MRKRKVDIPCDPIAALKRVAKLSGVCLLHSGMTAYGLGRYSILAACPWKTFSYRDGVAEVEVDGVVTRREVDLFEALERELEPESYEGDLPFYSGPIGYFSYDAGRYIERIEGAGSDFCEARFGFYRGALVFDHVDGVVYLTGEASELEERLLSCEANNRVASTLSPCFRVKGALSSDFTKGEYCSAVSRVREYIREGEVYQVNLSQRFSADCSGSAADLFIRLSKQSAAPYAAYLDFGDEQIVSSSPERFLTVEDGVACTRPIKGTRPAGDNAEERTAFAKELEESEKDRSELLMILDLERNDLGKVCQPGSISVKNLFAQEHYSTVIHQTAEVSGMLEDGVLALDCVKALFPGGSITGAPKIRAMEVIAELERGHRGVYTGAIGYLNTNGNADFNIAIRTIRVADGKLSFQVGGGIVWDSDPEGEYEETLLKAKAMKEAIGASDGK